MLEAALKEPHPTKDPNKKLHQQMPPKSHTLTDLLITLSPHLPPSTHAPLFNLTSTLLPLQTDPPLQKKAYKLLPRLATTPPGAAALRAYTTQLQTLLLSSASTTNPAARRDRLAAIATLIPHLPSTNLAFIPSILSEVVLAAKEVNEKARTQAYDLLVLMGKRMSEPHGVVVQSQIPAMGPKAPDVPASLEEFFTMVSAGLAGSTPHVISASITALTRLLFEFSAKLERAVVEDLLQTMELFLSSPNREIVRSVTGFVKVAVISLPVEVVQPRLDKLVPALLGWSKEHKARVRVRVKHILERMIRRFGGGVIEDAAREVGDEERRFVHGVVKARERAKRQKGKRVEEGEEGDGRVGGRRGGVDSAFDDAIASESDDEDGSGDSGDMDKGARGQGRKTGRRGAGGRGDGEGGTYITEDNDEPLDLLSSSSLAHISSRKPAGKLAKVGSATKRKHKTDQDGKLIFGGGDEDDVDNDNGGDDTMMLDDGDDDMTLEQGVNAYVDAIKGRDAVVRGRGGRLKFSNKREKEKGKNGGRDGGEDGGGDKAGGNGGGVKKVRFAGTGTDRGGYEKDGRRNGNGSNGGGGGTRGRGRGNGFVARGGRGGIAKRVDRKGLGGGKVRGGRVGKGVGRR